MSSFLKIAIRNFFKPPRTDPYPFGETFLPETFRGKLSVNPNLCTACYTCEEVCPSGAIHIIENEECYVHTTWYNTCCFCGNCEFFCPTGAIKLSNDFHTANTESEKFKFCTISAIKINKCEKCGNKFVPPSKTLLEKSYPHISDEIEHLTKLCPECRKKLAFERFFYERDTKKKNNS